MSNTLHEIIYTFHTAMIKWSIVAAYVTSYYPLIGA